MAYFYYIYVWIFTVLLFTVITIVLIILQPEQFSFFLKIFDNISMYNIYK